MELFQQLHRSRASQEDRVTPWTRAESLQVQITFEMTAGEWQDPEGSTVALTKLTGVDASKELTEPSIIRGENYTFSGVGLLMCLEN